MSDFHELRIAASGSPAVIYVIEVTSSQNIAYTIDKIVPGHPVYASTVATLGGGDSTVGASRLGELQSLWTNPPEDDSGL